MPTILEILEIEIPNNDKKKIHGTSLLNYINEKGIINNNKKIRVDARFLNQDNRISALRGNNHKIVYYHDPKKYEFFSVGQSHLDEKKIDIENNPQAFNEFKTEFIKSEELALDAQAKYLIFRLNNKILDFNKFSDILIIYKNKLMSDAVEKAIGKLNKLNVSTLDISDNQYNNKKIFDLIIIISDDYNKNLKNLLSKINYKKKIFMDNNMNVSKRFMSIKKFLRNLYNNKNLYIQEPTLIFWLIKNIFMRMIKK